MLARGALGNPWLFEEVLGRRDEPPGPGEVLAELDWVIDCACEHLGRAAGRRATCGASTRGTSSASACHARWRGSSWASIVQAESFAAVRELLEQALARAGRLTRLAILPGRRPPSERRLHAEGRHPHP